MLILRVFGKVQKFENLHCFQCIRRRFLSVENEALPKDSEVSRRYVKPLTNTELKPLDDNFLHNLFEGVFNKKIFEYPTVLRESDINTVINHGDELEGFLRENRNAELSEDIINELRKMEMFGLTVPQKFGGAGYNETECTFLQECTGLNPTIGRFLGYNENFGCKILKEFGTEEQKEKYLPRVAQGKSYISLAYLENGPLIDLSKIKGYAIGDEKNKLYILSAEKKWVHNADKADLFLLMVKRSEFLDKSEEVSVKFSFFIIEKNTPGVTVHKLVSNYAQENNLFDVSFKDVSVPYQNLLGTVEEDGFLVLKKALSYNNVTDATLCSHMIKQIIYNAIDFINEKSLQDKSIRGNRFLYENIALLSVYIYALESAIYLVTGRFDSFISPDLFNESVFVKALAVDFLHISIKNYTEILGHESLKSSGLLEQAIKTVQYYSVFDENIEYLKMLSAAEGMVHSAKLLRNRILMRRKPHENPEVLLKALNPFGSRTSEIRNKHKYKLEFHQCLSDSADLLEDSVTRFQKAVEDIFTEYGSLAMNNEHVITRFSDMAAYLYSLTACLARASSAVCYDFPNFERDVTLTQAYAHVANAKIKSLCLDESVNVLLNDCFENIGNTTFAEKQYPAEHPLSRTF